MSPAPSRNAEFNQGGSYERYSGEGTRGRVTTEGMALGGTAAGAAAGASSLAGAKLAGTPVGQQALATAERHATLRGGAAGPAAAGQLARYRRYGALAGRHRASTAAGIVGLTGAASLARVGQRMRQNEEAGISQSVGRMKAGEGYQRTQVLASKSLRNTLGVAALGNDMLSSPRLIPTAKWLERNRKKLTIAGLSTAGAAGAVTAGRGGYNHQREFHRLRGDLAPVAKGGRAFALIGALTGGGGLGTAAAMHSKHNNESRELAASVVGGWAGQGVYQGIGYGAKKYGVRHLNPQATEVQRKKALKPVQALHGAYTPAMERHYPKSLPEARLHRTLGWTHHGKTGTALSAASSAGGTLLGLGVARRFAGKQTAVDKSATPHDLMRWGAGLGAGTALGTAGTYAVTRNKKQTAGTVAGGLAGQGLYQGAGYATTNYVRARTGQSLRRSDLSAIASGARKPGRLRHDLAPKKSWEARMNSRRRHTAANTVDGKTNWAKTYRTWPADQPYSTATRIIGHTHNGRRGVAIGAAATAGGAMIGAHSTRGSKPVAKLYVQDQQFSPARLLATGAGVGLAAWGLGRSGMVGRALASGLRAAHRAESPYAVEALQRALAVQGVMRSATAPGERAMRSIRAVDEAINRVPAFMRPEIATAAGALLVNNGHPIRRNTYHPVTIRIRSSS